VKRWALTFSAPHAYPPYELIAGERTVIGRGQTQCDVAFDVPSLARRHGAFQWRAGKFFAVDFKTTNGMRVAGQRVNEPHPIAEGDHIEIAGLRAKLEAFDAALLDDVEEQRGWILYGRRRGMWNRRGPAFRRRDGRIERAIVAVPLGEDEDVVVHPDADGVLLARFAHALRTSEPDFAAFSSFVVASTAGKEIDASDLVVTWDGALARLPTRATSQSAISDALSHHVLAGSGSDALFSFSPERLANLVRALFPDAWREERELREQLDALDDEGVRWLLERNQRTP
jgi:hypothetical protein